MIGFFTRLCVKLLVVILVVDNLVAQNLVPEEPETPVKPSPSADNVEKDPVVEDPSVNARKPGVTRFGKISIIGSHQQVRGGIASMVESLRTELNALCNEKGREMKLPLVIRLYGAQGDEEQKRSIVSDIEQIQGQYQLNIRIHLARGVDRNKLRYHAMEMLLYERGLGKGQAVEEGERVLVKPWLIVGLLEAVDIRAGRANRKIYQANVPFFKILPLQEVFDASEKQWRALEGRKPLAFRVISGAMVSSLIRQPKGRPSMAAYLADFATFKGESENLMRKHFPAMNQSQNSLEKWVNLEMLELGTARKTEVFSILQTEKRLDSILQLRYRDEEDAVKIVGIDGYAEILKIKDPRKRFDAVAGARNELERLSYRCFPTYRPLLGEYEMILRDVIRGKDKDINIRLKKLTDVRMKKRQAAERSRDYLDWYYITQSEDVGGSFRQYRELSDALEKESMRLRKNDTTESYLDRIQRIFVGPSKKR